MQSYNVYTINWYKLAAWLVPKPMRKPKLAILVKAMMFPLIAVYNLFLQYRKAKIYQLTITGQVCYLERMLNDKYDLTLRRIYITDAEWHLPWFIFLEAENKPKYVYTNAEDNPVYVYTNGEAGEALNDFVVWVPIDINFSDPEMKSAIDFYKLFGTKYTIQRF